MGGGAGLVPDLENWVKAEGDSGERLQILPSLLHGAQPPARTRGFQELQLMQAVSYGINVCVF